MGYRMAKSNIPAIIAFEQPILDQLKKRGGAAYWNEIIGPVADTLGISTEDRKIMSLQKKNPKPVFVVRLRWASYRLSSRGKISREHGKWII